MRRSETVTAITCFVLIAILILTAKHSNAMTFDGLEQLDEVRQTIIEESHWESIGQQRITTYCPSCNDPCGYQSSSGTTLYEGCVACSWLPVGTRLRINGNEYLVVDTCGTDAIDIFTDTAWCQCNANYYSEVEVWR